LRDAREGRTSFYYDGHGRLSLTRYPLPVTPNSSNPDDYEELSYDRNGNVVSRRLRDGRSIGYSYDTLDRPILKDLPAGEADVSYGYDLIGRLADVEQGAALTRFIHDGAALIAEIDPGSGPGQAGAMLRPYV
jgi:YD repeat-containing protein